MMLYLNYYHCGQCNHYWTDEWDCACNDECGICGTKDIEPYYYLEFDPEEYPDEYAC